MATINNNYQPVHYDDYITPPQIWDDIAPHIPKNLIISMPFYADGSCGDYMKSLGFNIIHNNEDFFQYDRGEVVIDNPPYNIKKEIINTLIKRDKAFMLLVPVSTLCYQYTRAIKDHLQLIILPKRPKFIKYNKKLDIKDKEWKRRNCPFECLWLCYKMNFDKDIIFL